MPYLLTALHVYLFMLLLPSLIQSYLLSLHVQRRWTQDRPAYRLQISKEAITPYQRAPGRDVKEDIIHFIYKGVVFQGR